MVYDFLWSEKNREYEKAKISGDDYRIFRAEQSLLQMHDVQTQAEYNRLKWQNHTDKIHQSNYMSNFLNENKDSYVQSIIKNAPSITEIRAEKILTTPPRKSKY